MTKGEILRYAIAFALRRSRKIIRGLKEGLTEEERFAVADHAVAQLKERGDPWRLNEEAPTAKPPSTWGVRTIFSFVGTRTAADRFCC